jgi:hypothetical protein
MYPDITKLISSHDIASRVVSITDAPGQIHRWTSNVDDSVAAGHYLKAIADHPRSLHGIGV